MNKFQQALLGSIAVLASSASSFAQNIPIVVTGNITYSDQAFDFTGRLPNTPQLPVRFADCELVNVAGVVVGTPSFTNAAGAYTLNATVPAGTLLQVRVVTRSSRAAAAGLPILDTSVAQGFGVPPFQLLSAQFAAGSTSAPINLNAPIFQAAIFFGPGTGAPLNIPASVFNIFDVALSGMEYAFRAPNLAPRPPASSSVAIAWPGLQSAAGVTASGPVAFNGVALIEFDDSLDDTVVLHEVGHLIHFLYVPITTPGGFHTFGESDQDPRLSFSEGWATYYGSVVRRSLGLADPGIYVDTGTLFTGGSTVMLQARLEDAFPFNSATPGPLATRGDADELAIAGMLWDAVDLTTENDPTPGVDDDALGAPSPALGVATDAWLFSTLRTTFEQLVSTGFDGTRGHLGDFWDAGIQTNPAIYTQLRTIFESWGAFYSLDANEPNETPAQATTVALDNQFVTGNRLYPAQYGNVPNGPDLDVYRLPGVVIGSSFEILSRYPGNAVDAETMLDTRVELSGPDQTLLFARDFGGGGRSGALSWIAQSTGDYFATVRPPLTTALNTPRRPYGNYDVRFRYTFQNFVPTWTAGVGAASPALIGVSATSELSATAVDGNPGQTPSYQWSLLDGGSISGSGSAVIFTPPAVSVPTNCRATTIATDPLGATSAPLATQVMVLPNGSFRPLVSAVAGQTLTLELGLPPGALWYLYVSADPANPPYSIPGVIGQVGFDANSALTLVNGDIVPASGVGTFSASVPGYSWLIGQDFFYQALYWSNGVWYLGETLQLPVTSN